MQARALAERDSALQAQLGRSSEGFARDAEALISAPATSHTGRELSARFATRDSGVLELQHGQVGGQSLRLTLQGAKQQPLTLSQGKATAVGVLPDTDLVVTSAADRVEILLILQSAHAPNTFDWQVELGERLQAVQADDGSITLEDAKTPGTPVLRIPPAFAIDATGKRVPVTLSWSDSHLIARLNPEGLVYPILVDPAFETYVWAKAAPASAPDARFLHAAAYDSNRNVGVVFGGHDNNADFADTWEWSGTNWSKICPGATCVATPITGRRGPAMAFDSLHNLTVLFGGRAGGADQQETWQWSGTQWTSACTTACTKPSARQQAAMAFDVQNGVSVLFGGYPANQETWTFNGTSWTQQCTGSPCIDNRPDARFAFAMAYDESRKVTVLFGGFNAAISATLQDTWEWSGTAWTKKCLSACTPPGARARHSMAYDSHRKRVVLVGGFGSDVNNGPVLQDTWEWDGSTWVKAASAGPTALQLSASFYDRSNKRVVEFGGGTDVNPDTFVAETWLYHARGAQCSAASTCDTGFCTDGVCCEVSSCSQCYSCDVYDAANGYYPGTCNPTRGVEDTSGTTCSGTNICTSAAAPVCKKKSGEVCGVGTDCATGNCVDSTCCTSTCTGACKSCANATGTCTTNIANGSTDANSTPVCNGNNVCDGAGTCKLKQGQTCGVAGDCASGNCVDTKCCESACTATCKSCNNAAGTCTTNVATETTDANANPACSGTDVCNGAGTCLKKRGQDCTVAGDCSSGFCSGNKCCNNACNGACDTCATGTCALSIATDPGTPSCSPYLCDGAQAACPAACTLSTQCGATFYCDGAHCQPDKAVGDKCTTKDECPGNVNCVDGVCCNAACTGACVACTALKKGSGQDGTCGSIADGGDPRAPGCSTGSTSCDADGKCDGAGICRTQAPQTTSCGTGTTCEGNSVKGQRCNGAGDCITSGVPFPCAPAKCDAGACTTSCVNDAACDPDAGFCNLQGHCETRKDVSSDCGTDGECKSGHCVDGICCNTACDGACQSCESGSCKLVASKDPGTPSCSPFICDGKHADCPENCTADDVCAGAFYCKISDNTCQPRVNGTACTADDQCPDKHCVDGVCCESACDGQCEMCNDAGTCVAAKGAPVGDRDACPGDADCAGSCNGKNRTECTGSKAAGTSCGAASCAANIGRLGACDAEANCQVSEQACDPFVCGETECKTECATDDDCQSGFICDGKACKLSSSTCSDDGTSVVDQEKKSTDCDPYLCEAGKCLKNCSDSTDCQSGKICNTSQGDGVCEAASTLAPEADSGCGCRTVGTRSTGSKTSYAWLLMLSLVGLRRRRAGGRPHRRL